MTHDPEMQPQSRAFYENCVRALGLLPHESAAVMVHQEAAPITLALLYRLDIFTAIQKRGASIWPDAKYWELGALYHPATPFEQRIATRFLWASRALQSPLPHDTDLSTHPFTMTARDGTRVPVGEIEGLTPTHDTPGTTLLAHAWVLPREGAMACESKGKGIWWAMRETMRLAQDARALSDTMRFVERATGVRVVGEEDSGAELARLEVEADTIKAARQQ